MFKLSILEILEKIQEEECFSAIATDGSFSVFIDEYVPYVCLALHNGGNLREELRKKIKLKKFERWYEEDVLTGEFIFSLPIRIMAHDSRYEYDLNRSPLKCVYEKAWGKEVWKRPLTEEELETTRAKHKGFYQVIEALVRKIEQKFSCCIVYDIHSYNHQRIKESVPPVFNIGTVKIDKKFRPYLDHWLDRLRKIKIEDVQSTAMENAVFKGKGYLLKFVTKNFSNTLVLATEIKKIYCDELSGDIYTEIVMDLKKEMKNAIVDNSTHFLNHYPHKKVAVGHRLLSSRLEPKVKEIDHQLYSVVKKFDVLSFVNPNNLETEKKNFFKSKFRTNPKFNYKRLNLDPALVKRSLYLLEVDSIHDITLQKIYRAVIDSCNYELELIRHREDEKFLYSSLKIYGEPDEQDLKNANFLLMCPDNEFSAPHTEKIPASAAVKIIKEIIRSYKFQTTIKIVSNIPSHAVFIPSKNLLRVKKNGEFTRVYAEALGHHEIGVHKLTTENASLQPLKIFKAGFPLATLTQEGLAILSEYHSGHLTIRRLKELALRVLAVNHMVKNNSFKLTFEYLIDTFKITQDRAFYITARIYRGGGFTKDYLYLRGFKNIKYIFETSDSFNNLLIGKTSYQFLDEISELVNRGILAPPKYITHGFKKPEIKKNDIIEYILMGIQ
jgi:uncharacterized protein (TIGR02421 family)